MHELYIAESIINAVIDSLPSHVEPEAVMQIHVQVGQLDAVIPLNLDFMFDAIKAARGMPWAELWIETVGVRCGCSLCGNEFDLDLPVFICPQCGSGQVEVLRGHGIVLNGISVEDGDMSGAVSGV